MSREDIINKGITVSTPYTFKVGDKVKIREGSRHCQVDSPFNGEIGVVAEVGEVQDKAIVLWPTSPCRIYYPYKDLELAIPEKSDKIDNVSPPNPTKIGFEIGKHYKCIDDSASSLKKGEYYKLISVDYRDNGDLYLLVFKNTIGSGVRRYKEERFHPLAREYEVSDVCAPPAYLKDLELVSRKEVVESSPLDTVVHIPMTPVTTVPSPYLKYLTGTIGKQSNVSNINQQEESKMTNRKVVTVNLFDDARGLPVQNSLVAEFHGIVTEDDDQTTIREVLMNNDLKGILEVHNEVRTSITDLDILQRTGNKVTLQPVLLKHLRWEVKA